MKNLLLIPLLTLGLAGCGATAGGGAAPPVVTVPPGTPTTVGRIIGLIKLACNVVPSADAILTLFNQGIPGRAIVDEFCNALRTRDRNVRTASGKPFVMVRGVMVTYHH